MATPRKRPTAKSKKPAKLKDLPARPASPKDAAAIKGGGPPRVDGMNMQHNQSLRLRD